ncbi:transposase [Clostridioides difficile]|nr:transposase [Clostridioides difficile]
MINKLFTTALYNLWNPSYFVATVSENTEEQIRKYINNQKKQVK